MSLLARTKGRHTRCSGWGNLALMVAAYRAYPTREVEPAQVPLISRADLAHGVTFHVAAPDWNTTPKENR